MTALASPAHAYRTPRINGRQTYLRAVRSEWTKLTTLRSTWVTTAVALLMAVGFAVIIIASFADMGRGGESSLWSLMVQGAPFAQIAIACLGALLVTGEYATGQMRSTLAAVPNRSRAYAAKATVIAVYAFLFGMFSSLLTWLIASAIPNVPAASFFSGDVLPHALGVSALYTGTALMSLAYGYLFRSTAGALAIIMTLLFVISIPLSLAAGQWEWAQTLYDYSLIQVSSHVARPLPSQWVDSSPSHIPAIIAFVAWVIVPFIGGWIAYTRRDA